MHELIDEKMVEVIRTTGKTHDSLPDRTAVLKAHGLPFDQPADNVIITGCQILGVMPEVLKKLAGILAPAGLSHTFLSQEFCCGNNLYRPAIKAKDEAALAECRALSKTFVGRNIDQAKELGASRIVIFCSPCYPIYKHAFAEENIVFYPQAIYEAMTELSWDEPIDYYAGCYRLHQKFSPVPMDLRSTEQVFGKIKNLSRHRISAPACCYKPEGLAHMLNNVQSRYLVHICTGCYFQALFNKTHDQDFHVLMLPELIHLMQTAAA